MEKITKSDFSGIADVGNHCDLNKLKIAISEAENFDLSELFCDFWFDISDNWTDETFQDLVNGGQYEGCSGKTRSHAGVKRILIYYAYSRYIVLNSFNDTPNGNVSKTNDFSIPKPLREVQTMADKYRSMGYKEFQRTMAFLCKHRDEYEGFDSKECKSCGCNGTCGSKTSTKGYGIKGTIISKY